MLKIDSFVQDIMNITGYDISKEMNVEEFEFFSIGRGPLNIGKYKMIYIPYSNYVCVTQGPLELFQIDLNNKTVIGSKEPIELNDYDYVKSLIYQFGNVKQFIGGVTYIDIDRFFSFAYNHDKTVIRVEDGLIDTDIKDIIFIKDIQDIEKIANNKYIFMSLDNNIVGELIDKDIKFYISKNLNDAILGETDNFIFAKVTEEKTNKSLLQLIDEVY